MDNYMDVAEFRSAGHLQELNRQFLHPLGLALTVVVGDGGAETIGPIVDNRDDPYPEDLYLPDVIEKIAGEFIA